MIAPSPESALWPLEIARLQAAFVSSPEHSARDALRGALWRLLFESLGRFLRIQSRGWRSLDPSDLEDIAAEIALEILLRAESGAWNPAGRSGAEISGYVAAAARNGWIDFVQRTTREPRMPEMGTPEVLPDSPLVQAAPASDDPADRAEARELARAVRECAEILPARERRVWFLRAFYEMSSRDIADHPAVRLNAPHVDVLVRRARVALRDCVQRKGHHLEGTPRAAFVELWDLLESMEERECGENPVPESGA